MNNANKPVVTFNILEGFDRFESGHWYCNLIGLKGHPKVGDLTWAHTSQIESIQFDNGKPIRIETKNTIYVPADLEQPSAPTANKD